MRLARPVVGEPVVLRLSRDHEIPGQVARHLGGGRCSITSVGYSVSRTVADHESTGRFPQWGRPVVDDEDTVEVE